MFDRIQSRHADQQAVIDVFLMEVEENRQGQDLASYISMMLPPQMLFRPTVLSNSVLFSAIFQFMQS